MNEDHMRAEGVPSGRRTPGGGRHVADLFTPLGDPILLRLLEFLVDGGGNAAECSAHLGVSHATAVRHLETLADSGWIEVRSAGAGRSYGPPGEQAVELMSLAGSMAAERSNVLARCTRINGEAAPGPSI